MRSALVWLLLLGVAAGAPLARAPQCGLAAWYGEEHRGKLMANGQPFDPDQLTAASWFYPLGTKLLVSAAGSSNQVEVVVTDRGPSRKYLRQGRLLDLSRAAFERLTTTAQGLLQVRVRPKSVTQPDQVVDSPHNP